jgi:tetratricopeptide (TPR) repeat protein/transcriptional regulator with XRE-family HTH domain
MDEHTDFATILREFMTRTHRTPTDLARLTGLSINTLKNWTSGVVQRPRVVSDLLTLAHALALDATDTTSLLTAAGHPPLATLHAQVEQTGDSSLRMLLAAWSPDPAPDPASASPPTPQPQSPRHHLRAPVADFIGRTHEIDQLLTTFRVALAQERGAIISGVQGMGGIGKTELAYLIAHQLRDAFPDAQLVLNLCGSSATPLTPEQTLQAIIHTLSPNAKLPDDLSALEQHYRSLLHNARMLIIADDARDAVQVQALLPPAGSAVLITSRQRFILPGMATVQLEQLRADEAVGLLRAICPRLDVAEADLIARACGYLPLALRISGSILHSIPALPVATYLARLGDECQRLRALRDPDDLQLDVEAALTLSYAQLDDAAQQVFRQLGVLVADFAMELAQAVVEAPEGVAVEEILQRLLRHNLILYDAEQARWRLHDLLRDLARNLLEAAGETEAAWWRYARAAVQIAEETQEQYESGGDAARAALARFDAERPHIDAGRSWAAAHAGSPEGDRLLVDDVAATVYISSLRYDVQRKRIPQCERALAAAKRLGDRRMEGQSFWNLGVTHMALGKVHHAIRYQEQALTIAREIDDRHDEGHALTSLGNAYYSLGDARRAIPYAEEGLSIARELGNRIGESNALINLGTAYVDLGAAGHAVPYLEQALTIARELGNRRVEGQALINLGEAYIELGDERRAIDSCAGARTIARDLADPRMECYALSYLARAQACQGDVIRAASTLEQAVTIFREVGDRRGQAECNWQVGLALAQQGARERALPLLRAAIAYEQEIGHAKAAEHATLLARLEAQEQTPTDLLHPAGQRAVGADADVLLDAAQL